MPQPFDLAWLTPEQQRAWRLVLVVTQQLQSELNRQLQADSSLSFQDFDVLVHLRETPDARLRLGVLADALGWERSRTSHHVARMAARGLVEREPVAGDGRGAWVRATRQGLDAQQAAAPRHVERVREVLFGGLDGDDVADLARILTVVAGNLGCEPRTMWHVEPDGSTAGGEMVDDVMGEDA